MIILAPNFHGLAAAGIDHLSVMLVISGWVYSTKEWSG